MTLATWKAEFYDSFDRRDVPELSDAVCVKHAIKKWTGLLPENLEKHGVSLEPNYCVYDGFSRFYIDYQTCMFCIKYYSDCLPCPLARTLGFTCDSRAHRDAPYVIFRETGDPVPMLDALKLTLENLEK